MVKPVVRFVKNVVAPVVLTKMKIMNMSGDVLGKVLPGHWVSLRMWQGRYGEQSVTKQVIL